MMATTISQIEALPEAYPASPDGLSDAAAAIAETVWQRLESYIAHRWSARDVTWVVEGPGEWVPPLKPATISTVEVWSSAEEFETCSLAASPLGGYWLPCTGPYRFAGTVGSGEVPARVNEAFKRLAEYLAAEPVSPGVIAEAADGVATFTYAGPAFMARALQNSGAADLLRPYRRA